jgi:hypothetical protein
VAPADLLARRFRLSGAFRPTKLSDLTPGERFAFGEVRADAGIDYLLIPRVGGLSAKAVDAKTAEFLLSFVSPRSFDRAGSAEVATELTELQRLILDSILEIEGDAGFLTGPRAAELLALEPSIPGSGAVSRVSEDALAYGAALGLEDAPLLSTRLYTYNTEPRSPEWTRTLPSAAALERWLGIDTAGLVRRQLDRRWRGPRRHRSNPDWIFFHRSAMKDRRVKLYVAPATRFVPEAFPEVISAFERNGIGAFKIGGSLAGVLRPDKLVAYADTSAQVAAAASEIERRLRGMPTQPVPFSASIDAGGLASWGIDPPADERVSNWQGPSWRRWITDRLAVALVAATTAGSRSPSAFATQRISLDGVDPSTWAPTPLLWASAEQ